MKRLVSFAILLVLLGVSSAIGHASREQAAPEPTVILSSRFETVAPAPPFDLIVQLFEQEPGAWAPPHLHASAAHLMVLEGSFTNIPIVDGANLPAATYGPGETIVEPAWAIHEAGNLGTASMRYLSPRLQPRDAPITIPLPIPSSRPGAPTQRVVHRASTEMNNLSGPVDLFETWSEWAPGASSGVHFHPGVELGIVTEGELTVTKGSATTTVGVGDSFVASVGEIHAVFNAGTERARLITTHVVASGQQLTFAAE